jgi:hypothetical protein
LRFARDRSSFSLASSKVQYRERQTVIAMKIVSFGHWLRPSPQTSWTKRNAKNLEASDFRKRFCCVRRHEGQHSSRHRAIAKPIDRRRLSCTHFD